MVAGKTARGVQNCEARSSSKCGKAPRDEILEEITMPKFMCLQVSDPSLPGRDKPSAEQMQSMYEQFNAWREAFDCASQADS